MSKFHKFQPLHICFDKTLKFYNVRGSALAEHSGASPAQISQFRNGQRNLTTAHLEKLLVSLDEIAPGSRVYFYLLAAGPLKRADISSLLSIIADGIQSDQTEKLEIALV